MSYRLTERTKSALQKELVEPNLVLVIEGYDRKLSIRISKRQLIYDIPGLTYDMDGLFYDGLIEADDQDELISVTGTTTNISAQLDFDKGAATSTQTLTLKLLDINEQITKLASPGVILDDIMYKNAKLYFGLYETSFPEDYIQVFDGKIMGVTPSAGTIDFVVTHPDDLKRSNIFVRAETELSQSVDFDSKQIQDIFYQKRADVVGAVTVQYVSALIGDNAIVSVAGNNITVQVDTTLTKAKTVKKKIENNEDANQLVALKITGNANAIQTATGVLTLESDTEIFVESVSDFLLPVAPLFRSFVKINDEIIEYTGIDTTLNKFTGCTRQALTSFGAFHEVGDQVQSFYKFGDSTYTNGNSIDLTLKLLMSGASNVFSTQTADRVNEVPGIGYIQNAIYFPNVYLMRDENLQVGDTCSLTGSVEGNNFTDKLITKVAEIDAGSYVVVAGVSLNNEDLSALEVDFKSKFNVLPDGCGLLPSQVDIEQFEKIRNLHSSAIAKYEFYLKDTINSKEFLNIQLMLPSALYSMPRKGRVSVGINAPALYDENSKNLTLDTVKGPAGLKMQRSVNQNFYNSVVYKYNPDSVEDRSLNKNITISADSSNRIGAPLRIFQITADGLRPNQDAELLINQNSRRFLDRYKYGAETIKLNLMFKTGFGMEVGDAVLFGDSRFQIADTKSGSKNFKPRVMEVINKEWNWKTGDIAVTLIDTSYSANFRVGVFSPSSLVGSGSTTTEIKIKNSFGTSELSLEKDKWQNYIGREIIVHSEDWSYSEITYLQFFKADDDYKMVVSPALPSAPVEDYIVDIVDYAAVDPDESFYKNAHCFFTPQVQVLSGVSQTQFTVSDPAKFFVGSFVRVHNYDYSIDSGTKELKVTNVTGSTITIDKDLGFVPTSVMFVDLIGFASDEGAPYTFI